MLRSMRQIKLLTQVMLNQKQKLFLKFQRRNIIETTSQSDSDTNKRNDVQYLIESKNLHIKLATIQRIKRMLLSYKDNELNTFDKRLISGLFKRRLNDFDEEERKLILQGSDYNFAAQDGLYDKNKTQSLDNSADIMAQLPDNSRIHDIDQTLPLNKIYTIAKQRNQLLNATAKSSVMSFPSFKMQSE